MSLASIACARCASDNHPADKFCATCGLSMGSVRADAGAVLDVFGNAESSEPFDPDLGLTIHGALERTDFQAVPFGAGWRLVVPLENKRQQAVYVGPAGTDSEGRLLVMLVSVCGPANDRKARDLLKLNSRMVEGFFAIRVLRGEEYFVVVRMIAVDTLHLADPSRIVLRIAERADGLERQLSRGDDVY